MLKIAYIGKLNQTNGLIGSTIEASFSCNIRFHNPAVLVSDPSKLDDEGLDLVIFDLNTSSGLGNAPDNIKKLNRQLPTSPLLVMHPYKKNKFITPLIDAGANGVISITPSEDELTLAIDNLLNGESYISQPE